MMAAAASLAARFALAQHGSIDLIEQPHIQPFAALHLPLPEMLQVFCLLSAST